MSGSAVVATVDAPLVDLGGVSPLQVIACALQAQLGLAFPPRQFDFQFVTGPVTKVVMQRLTRRLPALALAFHGVAPDRENGRVFYGTSRWSLLLITANEGSPQARLFGDQLAPGLFAMINAASVALQGFEVEQQSPPAGVPPWCAEGAVVVSAIDNIAAEGWEDSALATAQVDLSVRFAADFAPGAGWGPDMLQTLAIRWNFGAPADDFSDTWTAPLTAAVGPNGAAP